jgi:hypothetical protein
MEHIIIIFQTYNCQDPRDGTGIGSGVNLGEGQTIHIEVEGIARGRSRESGRDARILNLDART